MHAWSFNVMGALQILHMIWYDMIWSHSYGMSLAIWDHTVLPVTRHKWTHPTLTPASRLAAATGKARSPIVLRRVTGTTTAVDELERRLRLVTTSAARLMLSATYTGAVLLRHRNSTPNWIFIFFLVLVFASLFLVDWFCLFLFVLLFTCISAFRLLINLSRVELISGIKVVTNKGKGAW